MSDEETKRHDFDEIDTDEDGYITAQEWADSVRDNPRVSPEHVEKIVAMADADADAKISFDEYAKFVR